jgi:hypothetical protein
MTTLIVRNSVGNIPTAYQCSDCAKTDYPKVFPVPSEGSPEEKKRIIEEQFEKHLSTEHAIKKAASGTDAVK